MARLVAALEEEKAGLSANAELNAVEKSRLAKVEKVRHT